MWEFSASDGFIKKKFIAMYLLASGCGYHSAVLVQFVPAGGGLLTAGFVTSTFAMLAAKYL
jgi:hypothetical protein